MHSGTSVDLLKCCVDGRRSVPGNYRSCSCSRPFVVLSLLSSGQGEYDVTRSTGQGGSRVATVYAALLHRIYSHRASPPLRPVAGYTAAKDQGCSIDFQIICKESDSRKKMTHLSSELPFMIPCGLSTISALLSSTILKTVWPA